MQTAASAVPTTQRQVLLVLFIGVFMAALDTAVIAPAIPALRTIFEVDNRQIALITIVYALCSLCSTPLFARLGDRYGRRSIYLLNIAGFAVGSLVIALAPNLWVVLIGRAIQGLNAGGITPTASAVIGDTFSPEERPKALGLLGATFGMAFLLGPLLASLILVVLSWQWLFLVNLPFALLVIWLGWRYLPSSSAVEQHQPLDYRGLLVVVTLLISVTLAITQVADDLLGRMVWPWMLGLALVCVPLLLATERRAAAPMVPLGLFRNRQLALIYLLTIGGGFGMGAVIFITSLAVEAYATAENQAGLWLAPVVICSAFSSMGAGRWLNQVGSRVILLGGFGVLAFGYALFGVAAAVLPLFLFATVLVGLGIGVVIGGTPRFIVLNEASAADRGAAQGLVNIVTSIGNLLSAAVIGALADWLGRGLAGFAGAYLAVAVLMAMMVVLALGLKSRQDELGRGEL
jgi:multidrug resistance protein